MILEEFHGLLKIADKLVVKGSIEVTNCEALKLIAAEIQCDKGICIVDCDNFAQKIKSLEVEVY